MIRDRRLAVLSPAHPCGGSVTYQHHPWGESIPRPDLWHTRVAENRATLSSGRDPAESRLGRGMYPGLEGFSLASGKTV